MEKPIEHKGRVVLVEGDRIDVEMTVEGACATCKAAKACGMGESRDKVVSLLTASAGLYEVGDEVMVSIERKICLHIPLLHHGGGVAGDVRGGFFRNGCGAFVARSDSGLLCGARLFPPSY